MDGVYMGARGQKGTKTIIEYMGIRATLEEWSRRTNIPITTIRHRLYSGYPVENILLPGKIERPENQKSGWCFVPQESQTLCWDCKHAVPTGAGNGCSWSRSFQPVEGWEAEKTHPGGRSTSYHVKRCPRFERG